MSAFALVLLGLLSQAACFQPVRARACLPPPARPPARRRASFLAQPCHAADWPLCCVFRRFWFARRLFGPRGDVLASAPDLLTAPTLARLSLSLVVGVRI